MYYEEKHTEYMRNCKVFDSAYWGKHAYIVFEDDGEYGYGLFRGVAYNFNDAYSIARERIIKNEYFRNIDKLLVVEPQSREEFYKVNNSVKEDGEYEDTNLWISAYGEDGIEIDSVEVFGVFSYKEKGEQ